MSIKCLLLIAMTTLVLKRDSAAETAAANEIIRLFTDRWGETSQKTSREVTAIVLTLIRDACITDQCGEETTEHWMLKHSNDFLDKTIEQIQLGGPLKVVLSGNTFEDIIDNLKRIEQSATSEKYVDDIQKRLVSFRYKLIPIMRKKVEAEQALRQKALLLSLLIGIVAVVLFNVLQQRDYGGGITYIDIIGSMGMLVPLVVGFRALFLRILK